MQKSPFRKLSLIGLLFLISASLLSQDFTWMKGPNTIDQLGVYGFIGVSGPLNNPGSRDGAATWKDASGNFWMYGGTGYDHIGNYGLLSDLWKYNVGTNEWTYVKGNDVIAQICTYGTQGQAATGNKPGGRSNASSWADAAGNLWLFGGYGYDNGTSLGQLSDLWKYNIVSNEWTWMKGPNLCNQYGVYGTLGLSSPTNEVGARKNSVSWVDATGNLWLFGGFGYSATGPNFGNLNDLWRYNIILNEWTWVTGSNSSNQNGIYGTMGSGAAANTPGGRMSSCSWVDLAGNFWLFGGDGWDASTITTVGLLSDLWKYDPSLNEWTWMKGNNTIDQNGIYGSPGVPSPANMPGGRSGAKTWIDAVQNLWLFSGHGYPLSGTFGDLNDLWKYDATTNNWTWVRGSAVIDQNGIYGSQGAPFFSNIPGGRRYSASWIDASNNLWFFGGHGKPATGAAGSLNDLWRYTNCFISPITMTITSGDSTICAGESTSLTVTGSNNYLWENNNSTNPYNVIHPNTTTTYSVFTSGPNNCKYVSAFTQTVEICLGLQALATDLNYNIYPNPSSGEFRVSVPSNENGVEIKVFNVMGQTIWRQNLYSKETQIKIPLEKGVYYYQLKDAERSIGSGKLWID